MKPEHSHSDGLTKVVKEAVKQGHSVVDTSLLAIDLSIPEPPLGKVLS